jgi:3',5'-cyclic AMP phosphodiesterase CpdA
MSPHKSLAAILSLAIVSLPVFAPGQALTLPLKSGSVRFAVIGDNGTGGKEQYEVAAQMERYREKAGFDFVIMLGDNIYGGENAADMRKKFEDPYKPLLDAGVKFYASLGNHDNPNQRFYKPFNMGEKRYYSFKRGNVQLLALDSNYMDPPQLAWLDKELQDSDSAWKICFFHHPLYSDGKFHGPDLDLRARLEPLLAARNVNVVFSGHEHVYERITPKNGINYFVLGNSGELRIHGLKPSPDIAKGFDTDRSFMMVEIAGDELSFQTISRTGETVDSGIIERQVNSNPKPASN